MTKERKNAKISIILPCRNEESALGQCLDQIAAQKWLSNYDTEIIVVDNQSTDRSSAIAAKYIKTNPKIRLLSENEIGYGMACKKGFNEATGDILLLSDADMTHDFNDFYLLLRKINEGYDLVIGNRFNDRMHKRSMGLIRRFGNYVFSRLARALFGITVSDIHCGMRAIKKEVYDSLPLKTGGMEFASEMIIKGVRRDIKTAEVDVSYNPRIGESKLEAVRDGWRHLRFFLLFSPLAMFFIPSILMLIVGAGSGIFFYFSGFGLLGENSGTHPLFVSSMFLIVGYQLLFFSAFSKIYAMNHLGEKDESMERLFKWITIEKAGFFGIAISFIGIILLIYILKIWAESNFGNLREFKNSIVALTAIVIGAQTFFSAFMLSILGIKED